MSRNVLLFLLFILFITLAESEKEKSFDKIIIHVPYKIHKHHHTHTKYKIITIPEAKHESTIIYLKENQKETKPDLHPQESNFQPPHQESAATLLQHLQDYNKKAEEPEKHQTNQFATDQKFLESSNQKFIPNFDYQPMIIPPHENVIPQFSLKPVVLPQQMFTPKFLTNPTFHHQHNFIPNFDYQTIFQPPPQPFIPEYIIRQKPLLRIPQDNVAHATSHDYKTLMTRRPKSETYKVREEVQEDEKSHLHKHQHKIPTKIRVPSNGKENTYVHSGQKYSRNIAKIIPTDPNYEYEHIGYLIIDGKSRKIVGKNFKDEIHLIR